MRKDKFELLLEYYKLCDEIENLCGPRVLEAVKEIIKLSEKISVSIDDHTSVWGGAGPDCMRGRLAAAY